VGLSTQAENESQSEMFLCHVTNQMNTVLVGLSLSQKMAYELAKSLIHDVKRLLRAGILEIRQIRQWIALCVISVQAILKRVDKEDASSVFCVGQVCCWTKTRSLRTPNDSSAVAVSLDAVVKILVRMVRTE